MRTEKYYESHIKCDVLNFLRASKIIDPRSVVASEYVLGSTGRRADLAIHNGSKFIGIEIKSQHDSLARLSSQLNIYTACFDEVMVVLDDRHVEQVLSVATPQVSVFQASRGGAVELCRAAASEPIYASEICLLLLTMAELKKLTGFNAAVPIRRSTLLAQARMLPDEAIRGAVSSSFRQAFSDSSGRFWQSVRRRNVTVQSLRALSRFAAERNSLREKEDEKIRFWESWQQDAFAALGMTNS